MEAARVLTLRAMARLAPIVLVDEITAACSADEVTRLLVEPATWEHWQPEILHAEGQSPLKPGGVARGRARMLGFEVYGQSTALDVGDRHFVEDAVVGVHMQIRYDIAEAPEGGVTVRHTLELEPSGGVAGRALTWLLKRRLKKMQREALRALVQTAGAAR